MKTRSILTKTAWLALPCLLALAGLKAAQPQEELSFSRAELTTGDIASAYGPSLYKFDLSENRPQRYRLILRERRETSEPWKNLFAEEIGASRGKGTILTACFKPLDGSLGGNVLLSDEENAELSVRLSDSNQLYTGMGAVVPVPLSGIHDVVLNIHRSAFESPATEPGVVSLMTIQPSSRRARETGDAQYPRAELLLEGLPPQ